MPTRSRRASCATTSSARSAGAARISRKRSRNTLAYPIPATEKNIDAAIGQLMFRDGLRDRSTEDGWETIGAIIDEDELDFGISSAQGVDFYKEAFDSPCAPTP